MRLFMLLSILLVTTPVWGQSMCYYWVDPSGAVTSYTAPPLDIQTSSSISSAEGRLLIAMTDRCRNDQLIRAGVTTAAVEPVEEPPQPAPPDLFPTPEPGTVPIPEPEVQLPVPEATVPRPQPEPEAQIPLPEQPAPAPSGEAPPAAAPSTPERPELRLEPPGTS